MSQRERDRLVVVRQVAAGELKVSEGARRVGLSRRHMRRLVRGLEREGDASLAHGLRGRPSNRRLSDELQEIALAKAREETYRDFGPTLLSEHLEREGYVVSPSTLRNWMIDAGLWTVKPRRTRHRRRRERRLAHGEMVLMDTSIHDWLEGRSGEDMVLIALIDDATSRLLCRFFPRDTGAANRRLLVEYLERLGRMGAVYADRAGHFRVNFRRRARREKGDAEAMTRIHRALQELDIELIIALSPQAKGRVERLFGTLQDRLIKEMRVAGIASLAEANRFLEETFIPFWQERFTVPPTEPMDAHRALPEAADLMRIFADTDERVIRNDFTFRYKNRFYQIEDAEAEREMPRTRITIERRLDDTLRFRWRERYLLPVPLHSHPVPAPRPKPDRRSTAAPRPRPPVPASHPWRRFPIRVGKARPTTPAQQASLPTPQP